MAIYDGFNKEGLGTKIRNWYEDNKVNAIAGAITVLAGISLVTYLGYSAFRSDNMVQKNIPKLERSIQKFNAPGNTQPLETIFNTEK